MFAFAEVLTSDRTSLPAVLIPLTHVAYYAHTSLLLSSVFFINDIIILDLLAAILQLPGETLTTGGY